MGVLRTLHWNDLSDADRIALCDRGLENGIPDSLRQQIGELIEDVRRNGDDAVCRALAQFDGVTVTPDRLAVTEHEFADARTFVDGAIQEAVVDMIDHIRRFNTELMRRRGSWSFESEPGLMIGEKVTPIASAGLFCPSGKASYPSVLAQLGTPAVVAGV